ANGLVVDGRYRLVTARTKALCALYGRQFQHRPGLAAPILLTPIPYAITLPATQLGHTIHFGHGRPRFVASRTTILPGRPCASLPSVGRRTFFSLPRLRGARMIRLRGIAARIIPGARRAAPGRTG